MHSEIGKLITPSIIESLFAVVTERDECSSPYNHMLIRCVHCFCTGKMSASWHICRGSKFHICVSFSSKIYSSRHGVREINRWPLDSSDKLPDNTKAMIWLWTIHLFEIFLYILHELPSSISIFLLISGTNALILAYSFWVFSSSNDYIWNWVVTNPVSYVIQKAWSNFGFRFIPPLFHFYASSVLKPKHNAIHIC